MKDLTNTPSADLIEQWKSLRDRSLFLLGDCLTQMAYAIKEHNEIVPRIAAIADELDRRIVGIRNVHGSTAFSDYRQIIYAKNDPAAREAVINIPIGELRDRLTWIILKEGVNQ